MHERPNFRFGPYRLTASWLPVCRLLSFPDFPLVDFDNEDRKNLLS